LARYSVTNLTVDGTVVFVSHKLLHSERKRVRLFCRSVKAHEAGMFVSPLGWSLLAGQTMGHASTAIYNSQH
jgi:hypothetical protein